jgi:hypothetical protein
MKNERQTQKMMMAKVYGSHLPTQLIMEEVSLAISALQVYLFLTFAWVFHRIEYAPVFIPLAARYVN